MVCEKMQAVSSTYDKNEPVSMFPTVWSNTSRGQVQTDNLHSLQVMVIQKKTEQIYLFIPGVKKYLMHDSWD